MMQRVFDAPCSLAVYDFDAVGSAAERMIDLVDDACDGVFDRHAVQVYAAGWDGIHRRRVGGFSRAPLACGFLSCGRRRAREVLFGSPHRYPFNANEIASAAAGLEHHPSLLPKGQDDDLVADDRGVLLGGDHGVSSPWTRDGSAMGGGTSQALSRP